MFVKYILKGVAMRNIMAYKISPAEEFLHAIMLCIATPFRTTIPHGIQDGHLPVLVKPRVIKCACHLCPVVGCPLEYSRDPRAAGTIE